MDQSATRIWVFQFVLLLSVISIGFGIGVAVNLLSHFSFLVNLLIAAGLSGFTGHALARLFVKYVR
jgi:hypothetical protein